jgi:AHBA synthesis associated protein
MNKVLIFDFDGVLADTCDFMLRNAEIASRELGYPSKPSKEDLEALDAMTFDALGRRLGIPDDLVPEFTRRNLELFNTHPQPMPAFPGMPQLLVRLSRGNRIGIVTGNGSAVVQAYLDYYGLNEYIEIIVSQQDPGTRVEKINCIRQALGGTDGRVYLVGDAVSDILAARQAGIQIISVSWGHQSSTRLIEAGPDFLVKTPDDLYVLLE